MTTEGRAAVINAWFRFFRLVNVATVPGDLLVGAAAALWCAWCPFSGRALVAACAASICLYLYGLADNDIVGAATDTGRPIGEGLISLRAARVARGLCLFAAMIAGAAANLPPLWWIAAFALAVSIVAYNRTKVCLLMGLCRALNVLCGGLAIAGERWIPLAVCAAVWLVYIAGVTKYSEGEEADAAKKRRVGFLVGAVVYLQLIALLVFGVRPLLIAGAVLLVALRMVKRLLPKVSAS